MQGMKIVQRTTATTVLVVDPDYFGGAVVGPDGDETPITDDMVLHACRQLEADRFPFRRVPTDSKTSH